MRWAALFLLVTPWLAPGATLAERIAAVARSSPIAQHAFWGVKVVDPDSGKVLYEHNAKKFFLPASNAKLFTVALALVRLGPDHRFHTRITAAHRPNAAGVLAGDLRFVGGGDPTLSARKIPYQKGPLRGDPLGPLKALVKQLIRGGLRRVDGGVVGDDSAYVREPYPPGWAEEDTTWNYGAPVSALTLHDNAFRLLLQPGRRIGAPAMLRLSPPVDYYRIANRVRTVGRGDARILVEWPAGSRRIYLSGTIRRGAGARAEWLAVRDPARYAAWVLARELRRRGVVIRGGVKVKHRWMHDVKNFRWADAPPPPSGVVLAHRVSPPLFEILKVILKESQNLYAELVLREVGRCRRHVGSRAAGLAELKEFLAEAGISPREYHLEDACGLSRRDLVSPGAVVKLLSYMYLSTERDGWLDLLPVGGQDGTLDHRFRGTAAGRVFAKTGTLSHVSALSGYAQPRHGPLLAFSILVNNYNQRARPARRFIDRVVREMLGASPRAAARARGTSRAGSRAPRPARPGRSGSD